MDPTQVTPKLWMSWGGFLQPDVAFWSSYWALGKCTCLKQNDPSTTLLQPAKGSRLTSLEVFDVISLWSWWTNCVWMAGNKSCYLDVLHCLFQAEHQQGFSLYQLPNTKGKTEDSDLKTSALIAVQPLFALGKGGIKWCQRRVCQTFVDLGSGFVTLRVISLFWFNQKRMKGKKWNMFELWTLVFAFVWFIASLAKQV